jgi:S1-C subfamily serine protease
MVVVRNMLVVLTVAILIGISSPAAGRPAEGGGFIGIVLDVDRDGVVVQRFAKDSPGEKAGLKPGDVIAKLDGKPPGTRDEFIMAVRAKKPGDVAALEIVRGKETILIKVTLGE